MKDLSLPTVQVLERTLDILEALSGSGTGLGVSQISGMTQLPISTVHRLLKVLKRRGYAVQDPETRKYLLAQGTVLSLPPPDQERVEKISGQAY
jgi:DNA-binding IclR family transcriptional regulator